MNEQQHFNCNICPENDICPSTSNNSLENHQCWNCDSNVRCNVLFCQHCKKIQPPDLNEELDYFTLLDLPKEFTINNKQLHHNFKELQKILHPDKFATKTEQEKKISRLQSSIVNKAYETLRNVKFRAEYLLKLKEMEKYEIKCQNNENYHLNLNDVKLDPEFLMEVLEVNETINENELDKEELLDFQLEFQEKKRLLVKDLEKNFNQLNKEVNDDDVFQKIRLNIAELNYIDRTLHLIDSKISRLEAKKLQQQLEQQQQ
ncbi:hypothetical protein ABK040_009324 [Willaertia magna]